jgi:hypothetical protein
MRVAMAQKIDRNTAGKIKCATTILTDQPSPFAADRAKSTPGINGHQGSDRHEHGLSFEHHAIRAKKEKATQKGRLGGTDL